MRAAATSAGAAAAAAARTAACEPSHGPGWFTHCPSCVKLGTFLLRRPFMSHLLSCTLVCLPASCLSVIVLPPVRVSCPPQRSKRALPEELMTAKRQIERLEQVGGWVGLARRRSPALRLRTSEGGRPCRLRCQRTSQTVDPQATAACCSCAAAHPKKHERDWGCGSCLAGQELPGRPGGGEV